MTRIPATTARQSFSEVVNRASYGGQRFALMRNGKIAAGIVSAADLQLLESLEDLTDVRDAERIRAAIKSGREKVMPWDEVKKGLISKKRKPKAGNKRRP